MKTARAFKLSFQPGTTYDESDHSSLVVAWIAMAMYDMFVAGWTTLGYVGKHADAVVSGWSPEVGAWLAFVRIAIAIVVATQLVRIVLVRSLGPRRWPLMDYWLWSRVALLPPFLGFVIGLPAGLGWVVAFNGANWMSLLSKHLLIGGLMMAALFVIAFRRPFALRAEAPKRRARKTRSP